MNRDIQNQLRWVAGVALAAAAVLALAGCALAPGEPVAGGSGQFLEADNPSIDGSDVETIAPAEADGAMIGCDGVARVVSDWHPALIANTHLAAIVDSNGDVLCIDSSEKVAQDVALIYGQTAAAEWVLLAHAASPVEDPTPQPAMKNLGDPTPQPASQGQRIGDPTPQPASEGHLGDPTPQPAGQ